MMKKINLLALLFTLSLIPSYAQDSTSTLLNDVIIKENRLQLPISDVSRSIEIITQNQIKNAPARNIPELLSYVSGVDIRQRGVGGAQADINLRGGTFDQTLILINGVALADPQTGHHIMNLPLSNFDIERIEILKGASARIFGQNAFAGVVNIVTKTPTDKFSGNIGGSYEEQGTYQLRAGLNLGNKVIPTRVSYSRQFSNGYRANTDYEIQNFFFQSQANLGENTTLDLVGGHNTRKFGGSGFYAGPIAPNYVSLPVDNYGNEYEEVATSFANATLNYTTGNLKITPRLSWRRSNDDYYFVRNAPIFNSTKSNVLTADVNSSYKSDLGITGLGLNFQTTDFESLKLGKRERTQYSMFLEHRLSLLDDKLDVTAGFMFTTFSDFGAKVLPGIDVGYKIDNKFKIYTSFGNTFRVPTYTDLYFNNGANDFNANLTPETANNVEFGLKYNYQGVRISSAWFARYGTSIIDRVKTDVAKKWFPTNVTDLTVSGIEANVDFLPTILRGSDFWLKRLNVSATYLTTVKSTTPDSIKLSRYAADNLHFQANLNVEHAIFGKLTHSFNVRYFERFTIPVGNDDFYKGIIIDTRLTWTESFGRFYLQCNNLLSKKYVESNGITMPAKWVSLGLDATF